MTWVRNERLPSDSIGKFRKNLIQGDRTFWNACVTDCKMTEAETNQNKCAWAVYAQSLTDSIFCFSNKLKDKGNVQILPGVYSPFDTPQQFYFYRGHSQVCSLFKTSFYCKIFGHIDSIQIGVIFKSHITIQRNCLAKSDNAIRNSGH